MNYLSISYWNSSDVGGMLYHNHAYKNRMYFDTTPALFEETVTEEGQEDADKNFVATFRKTQRVYKCDLVCTPEMIEALYFIQQHDHIEIKLKNEEKQLVKDFAVTNDGWEFGGHVCRCTFQFTTQYIRSTASADNFKLNFTANLSPCIDLITSTSPTFINPSGSGVADGSRYIVTDPTLTDDIYQYTGGAWVAQNEALIGNIVYVSHDLHNYYFDGAKWRQYPQITSASVAGFIATIKGWSLPGTFVQLQEYVGGSWGNVGVVATAPTFQSIGIKYTTTAGAHTFRVHAYSHGYDYGYSSNYVVDV